MDYNLFDNYITYIYNSQIINVVLKYYFNIYINGFTYIIQSKEKLRVFLT